MKGHIVKMGVFGLVLGATLSLVAYLMFTVFLSSYPPYPSMLLAGAIVVSIVFWQRPLLRKVLGLGANPNNWIEISERPGASFTIMAC